MSLEDIIGDVMAPPPARGRKPKPISAAYRRDLNESDVKALWDIPEGGLESEAAPLVRLKHQHHYLARMLAEGKSQEEASLMTGMSPSRISVLKRDPAFSELVKYYSGQVGEVYINVHERLAVCGITSVDELMARLDETPEKFTNRELMELAALGHDRSGHGPTAKVQSEVTVLTADVIERLKSELASRANGTVRPLTLPSRSEGPVLGKVIDHEPLAETQAPQGSEGEGTEL